MRCWPATAGSGDDRDREGRAMIELTDTSSSAIAAEFVRARTQGGQPGHGHGDDADRRRRRGALRVGDGRRPQGHPRAPRPRARRRAGQRPGQRPGSTPRSAPAPAPAASWPSSGWPARWCGTPSPWCCRCCCPTRRWRSGGRTSRPPTRPPTRSGALARRRITDAAEVTRGKSTALDRAVRLLRGRQHRPGLDPAHPLARAAGRLARPAPAEGDLGVGRLGARSTRAPTCSPPGCGSG